MYALRHRGEVISGKLKMAAINGSAYKITYILACMRASNKIPTATVHRPESEQTGLRCDATVARVLTISKKLSNSLINVTVKPLIQRIVVELK